MSNQTPVRNEVYIQPTLFYNIIKKLNIQYRSILSTNTVSRDEKKTLCK
jgi:hypothetical protein